MKTPVIFTTKAMVHAVFVWRDLGRFTFVILLVIALVSTSGCHLFRIQEPDNHPPSIPEITLSPAFPTTGDDLICKITTPSTDPDGDEVTYSYQWYEGDEYQSGLIESAVDAEYTTASDTWRCVVFASDGKTTSQESSAQVTIGIDTPTNLILLVVSATQVDLTWDPATDPEVIGYKVYRDSLSIADVTDIYYSDTDVSPEVTYTYWITAQDVEGTESAPSGSIQATTSVEDPQNSPPTAPVVDVTPDNPLTTEDLTCTITTPSTDPDGDTITYSYQWYKEGVLQSGLTGTTVVSSLTAVGETWRSVVTASDGQGGSAGAWDEVTVAQGLPTLQVALSVKERSGIDRNDEPVTSGIPLSRDNNITNVDELCIKDSAGNLVPAQFRVLARYDGEPTDTSRPIRVVLVDFAAQVSANSESLYYLEDKGAGTMTGPDIASEDATHILLTTGAVTAKINKSTFNLFDQVYIDSDGDGQVDDPVVLGNPGDGITVMHQGTEYTSNNTPAEIVIEENGPRRAVVKVKGYYKDSSGNLLYPPLGDTGLSYTVRFEACKDQSYIKVDYALENENKGWTRWTTQPVHTIYIDSVRLTTSLELSGTKTLLLDTYEDSFNSASYELLQDHVENGQEETNNFLYTITKDGLQVDSQSARYEGQVALSDDEKGLMIGTRWFWQNWPKGLEVTDNTINHYLWPDMSYDHRIIGGIYKTHELIYSFHDSSVSSFEREQATLKNRLLARPSGEWFAQTDFFGPMAPAGVTSDYTFAAGEELQVALEVFDNMIRAKFDSDYIEVSYAPETLFTLREKRPISNDDGPLNWYGWLWFGDTPRGAGTYGYSAQHYAWDYVSLMHSLRFDDYNMFDIGEEFVSHKADIIIIHDPYGLDAPDEDLLFHGAHRYEQDALLSFNDEYSVSRQYIAGSSHFWIKGLILQYFLTGDERYKDVALQTGFHLTNYYLDWLGCDQQPVSIVESRNQSRAVNGLVDIYKLTGEQTYLDAAYDIFVNAILSMEGGNQGGWIDFTDAHASYSWTGNEDAYAHIYYDTIASEALVNLAYALKDRGLSSEYTEVKDFLLRQASWVRDHLYTNWEDGLCGDYDSGMTLYFPYTVKNDWREGAMWQANDGVFNTGYSAVFADTFAFAYRETGDTAWLDLARSVFKDLQVYGIVDGEWLSVKYDGDKVEGFYSNPQSAYLKFGNLATKPLFYLRTEWEVTQGLV
ncbi:MAG: hypothetical protein SVY53_04155 [Chloroflexota bacterium]|nr:hypothetical protein [Chloroflexota bacterium]